MIYQNFASALNLTAPDLSVRRRGVASNFPTPSSDLNSYLRTGMRTSDRFRAVTSVFKKTGTSGVGVQSIESTTQPVLIAVINGANLELTATTNPTTPLAIPIASGLGSVIRISFASYGIGEVLIIGDTKTQRVTLDATTNTSSTKDSYRYWFDKGSAKYVFIGASNSLRTCPVTDISGTSDTVVVAANAGTQIAAPIDGGKFLAWSGSSNSGYSSLDAITWTPITTSALALGISSICVCAGKFFARLNGAANQAKIFSSNDGVTWTQAANLTPWVPNIANWAVNSSASIQSTDSVLVAQETLLSEIYVSVDLGQSWHRSNLGATQARCSGNRIIYSSAASGGTVWITGEL